MGETIEETAELIFKFVVNDQFLDLCVQVSEHELREKLTNDDLYTFQYIYMLGEQKAFSVDGPVYSVKRIIDDKELPVLTEAKDVGKIPESASDAILLTTEETQLCLDAEELPILHEVEDVDGTLESSSDTVLKENTSVSDKSSKLNQKDECKENTSVSDKSSKLNQKNECKEKNKKVSTTELWNDKETSFLLDKYNAYVPHVGPMKTFKTKKIMWKTISVDLLEQLNVTRDYVQVENRYKTCLKRKKTAVDHNSKSGNARAEVPFEEELSRIASNDDSIEPEVLCSAKKIKYLKASPQKNPLPKRKNIQELAVDLHTKKEEAKERRHQEKLNLITALLKKNPE